MKIKKIKVMEPIVKAWVMKHKGIVMGWMINPIINQMANSGCSYEMINRWLRHIKHPVIVGYMTMPNKQNWVFFEVPTGEEQKRMGGRFVRIF